jgi:glycerophosphoryl diester phosphodiesterase
MPEKVANTPIVIAHRGASAYLPEHTLASKALAYGMGADYLEQDVIASRDGELLVLHDLSLDAVSDVATKFESRQREDGHFYCIDFDLDEIRTLQFGERTTLTNGQLNYPNRFPRDAGSFPVVTLREELRFLKGLNHATGRCTGIFTEIKAPAWHREQGIELSELILATLNEFGYPDKDVPVLLACFDAEELRKIRQQTGPGLKIIQLLSRKAVVDTHVLSDTAAYADGIGPSIDLIYQGKNNTGQPILTDLVKQAQDLGLAVCPYTFRADDLPVGIESFEALLDLFVTQLGVDGVITDFTDRVVAFRNR